MTWELQDELLEGCVDLGTSSQVIIISARLSRAKASAAKQERGDQQSIEDKQGNKLLKFI